MKCAIEQCTNEVKQSPTGRPGKYCSDRCRKRGQREREAISDVTKLGTHHENVTKLDKIKPIMKYPGAKWKLAPWIISHFPVHELYVEPYMGSAAIFFAKEPSPSEVVNDLDGNVVNLFRVLRERRNELVEQIRLTPWSRQEYLLSYEPCDDELEAARRYLVRCWQAFGTRTNVRTGWRNQGVKRNGATVSLWKQLPDRLEAAAARLQSAEIECSPALDVIKKYNDPSCLLYVDPPYVLSTRSNTLYKHEMTDDDHLALLDVLDKHTGSVVLSGYAHRLYDERLSHWQRVIMNAVGEKGAQRTEVLWIKTKEAPRMHIPSLFDFQEEAS